MQKNTIKKINHWVWLDLEMTGLDEDECAILEIAMIITDANFNHLDLINLTIWQPESILEKMVPLVRNMHTKNGLLKKVRLSNISTEQAQIKLIEIITKHVPFKKGILAGNSIYLDRRFLHKYMPIIDNYLHYRHLDVSSVKTLTENWFHNKGKAPKKISTHTAMSDIKQSIEELKFYKENCFKASI